MTDCQTILVVDDHRENRQSIMQSLKETSQGYELLAAPNGKVAFDIARKLLPDLIITDWDMPKMNGLELTKAVKWHDLTQDIPVLVVTGIYTSSENLKLVLDAGAVDYIRKPVQKLELRARVASTLALRRSFQIIEQKNEEIEAQKNKELSAKAFEIYRKNQLFRKIQDIAGDKDSKLALKNILKVVNDAIYDGDEWFAFRQYFDQIHPGFFADLRKKCPQLTTEDLKHCVFVRLHLSNKEIAGLLNIHVDSVYTHHYRIRKKLRLPSGVRFSDYIVGLTA